MHAECRGEYSAKNRCEGIHGAINFCDGSGSPGKELHCHHIVVFLWVKDF